MKISSSSHDSIAYQLNLGFITSCREGEPDVRLLTIEERDDVPFTIPDEELFEHKAGCLCWACKIAGDAMRARKRAKKYNRYYGR